MESSTSILEEVERICTVVKNSTLDNICLKQLDIICDNDEFRIRMIDANSKFPYTGLLTKTRLDLGNYDECINLDLTRNGTRVLGKNCLAGLIIPTTSVINSNSIENAFKLSTCIPDQCTAQYLLNLTNLSYIYPLFNDYSCSTKNTTQIRSWDYYVVSVVIWTILGLVVSATLYDFYYDKENTNLIFKAFSIGQNAPKLFKYNNKNGGEVQAIHGLRVISMMWIVLAHSCDMFPHSPLINEAYTHNFVESWSSYYVSTAYLAVDTFFFISGFLLSYQYLKKKQQSSLGSHLKTLPVMIIHRYIRLTPVALLAFLCLTSIFLYIGDGPLYHEMILAERENCLNYWWSYFTYLQNYVNYKEVCIVSTWYLSADWQLFLISPIILIPVAILVKRHFKYVMISMGILNLLFTIVPVILKLQLKDFDNYYETHVRLNDYFIGFALGIFMRAKNDGKIHIPLKKNILFWALALVTMLSTSVLYKETQVLEFQYKDLSYNSYCTILRTFWCLSLSWVLFACHFGYGGFINSMLGHPLIRILSRLTYCIYIIHVGPTIYLFASMRSPVYFSKAAALSFSLSVYVISVFLAVIVSLALESPIISLEKHFLGT
ncbi:hypothetical protein ABEB36_003447 [Hypothenemus hampei]